MEIKVNYKNVLYDVTSKSSPYTVKMQLNQFEMYCDYFKSHLEALGINLEVRYLSSCLKILNNLYNIFNVLTSKLTPHTVKLQLFPSVPTFGNG